MSSEYFSHDYKARSDPKLVRLTMCYGLQGVGAFWCIVEMLYENKGYLSCKDYERIAFELRVETTFIRSVIEDFQLFNFKNEKFYSSSVLIRLKQRTDKSEKARQSVAVRWAKQHTDVSPTNHDSNTIKLNEKKKNERKESDINTPVLNNKKIDQIRKKEKEKNSAKRERNTIPPSLEIVTAYCQERQNNIDAARFIDYYTAKGWMIGKERMKDWQAAVRTWETNKTNLNSNLNTKTYGKL